MKKVLTYGTFDHFHKGHFNILKRAKELGDYLIVGVTSDNFDIARGKINVDQNVYERIASVKATGLADEIIIEEYEGQKIDDIINNNVDIFTVGSDWVGKFDYLNDFCEVVYLERTKGISSSEIRSEQRNIRIGLVGNVPLVSKFFNEMKYVNGVMVSGAFDNDSNEIPEDVCPRFSYDELLEKSDAIYIASLATSHYSLVKKALEKNKHVLCESPFAFSKKELDELYELAEDKNLIIMEAIKTAYLTAFHRMILLAKSGCIGKILSVEARCTSLDKKYYNKKNEQNKTQGSIYEWAPIAVLPILQLFGTDYIKNDIITYYNNSEKIDSMSKINFIYKNGTGSALVAVGAKAESDLVITGTKGYIYIPSPWWKSEYFEIRYENYNNKKSYYYRSDGEGLRYEIACFAESIISGNNNYFLNKEVSICIAQILKKFTDGDIFTIE